MNHLILQKELKQNLLQLLKLKFGQNTMVNFPACGEMWKIFNDHGIPVAIVSFTSCHTESLPHNKEIPASQYHFPTVLHDFIIP